MAGGAVLTMRLDHLRAVRLTSCGGWQQSGDAIALGRFDVCIVPCAESKGFTRVKG